MSTSTYEILSKFVQETCATRDESHGWLHMQLVAHLSLLIISNLSDFTPEETELALICAWLHDVNDHKYGNENEEKLNKFLDENFSKDKILILAIIKRISFSNEKKNGKADWLSILGESGLKARNVVSDADKIDALDINRCYIYEKTKHPMLSEKETWQQVIIHCDEKLLLLKDNYIITDIGKSLAQPKHELLIQRIAEIKKQYNVWETVASLTPASE
jgi:HD superfamily phosphodiesterase